MANHRNNNYYICQARATLSPEDGSADDFGPREWKKLLAHEKQEWAAPDLSRVLGLAKQQVAGHLFYFYIFQKYFLQKYIFNFTIYSFIPLPPGRGAVGAAR